MHAVAAGARAASLQIRASSLAARNSALAALAALLRERAGALSDANASDLSAARVAGVDGAMAKRLVFDAGKIASLLAGLDDLLRAADPLGEVSLSRELAPGLDLRRVSCPLGVLAVIFEARPEAVIQIAALAIKSGNALILKGGKEAASTNAALGALVRDALASAALPADAVQLVESREEVSALLAHDTLIDLVIPRGSAALVRAVKAATRIPVLGHADGLCHVYVAASADADVAARVVTDSKTSYPAACNSAETLLLDAETPPAVVSRVLGALLAAGVTLHVDADCAFAARAALAELGDAVVGTGAVVDADATTWGTEWLSLDMGVATVRGVGAAINWVNTHGSHHTDAIVAARGDPALDEFRSGVDSASVFCNASTRFADGFRFGFGAEVGISTARLHARGPVGVEGLLTYRYELVGDGHVVAQFAEGDAPVVIAGQTLQKSAYTHVTHK